MPSREAARAARGREADPLPGLRLRSARLSATVFLSGAVLSLAWPEPSLAPIAWIAMAPLLVLADGDLEGARARRGAWLGFTFGLGFFGALLSWISIVGYVAWLMLVLLQAVFLAGFGALWTIASRGRGALVRICLATALWVAFEYARSVVPMGGFTWGQLAQSQHDLAWMLRPARIGGGWAVAALVAAANATIAHAWIRRNSRRDIAWAVAAAVALLAFPVALPGASSGPTGARVAIVQGNVDESIPRGLERELDIIASHTTLTEDLGDDIELVVWPESSLGLDPERWPEAADALHRAATAVNAPMIVGGNLDLDDDRYRVVALLIDESGTIVDRYLKTHLVPFGEYVPARSALGWIPMLDQVPRDAVAGEEHTTFEVLGNDVAPVISFEGDFGSLVRQPIDGGGRLLVVATNTSTWGESWASAQHVAHSQVRAAENGVWVVHAALSGISAFISPDGTVVERTPLWTATTLAHDVYFADQETFYTRYGDWLPVTAVVGGIAGAVRRRRRGDG